MNVLPDHWEVVIGLEIHLQLNTQSKLFSNAPNHFGDEPNTNIGWIDTAQPGTLPLLNKEAVKKAILLGSALNAKIASVSKFDRKSYFYPDSPRNFQITQFYHPIIEEGYVEAEIDDTIKRFNIHHAHLEDDAGMLKHFSSFAGVDYNRAGVPLIEIVSMPCISSAKEATSYAMAIRAIAQYLDISDCNMEEGSFRMDVNVSLRPKGSPLRNKTEVKNLNSFRNMEEAIEAEVKRQYALYEKRDDAQAVPSATLRFDLEKKETIVMRSKEEAEDYRYFEEPDIPPLVLSQKTIESIQKNLPELPRDRMQRYLEKLHLTPHFAALLVNNKPLSDYFEEGLPFCKNPKALCNWIVVEFVGRLKESGKTPMSAHIPSKHIGELISLIESGKITGKIAKKVADEMVLHPDKSPGDIVKENPAFQTLSDTTLITSFIDEVLEKNPDSITDFKNGKDKAFNFLVGQVMKRCQGKASPPLVKDMLLKKMDDL